MRPDGEIRDTNALFDAVTRSTLYTGLGTLVEGSYQFPKRFADFVNQCTRIGIAAADPRVSWRRRESAFVGFRLRCLRSLPSPPYGEDGREGDDCYQRDETDVEK